MNLNDARDLAIELMDTHGLIMKGWTFEYSLARSFLGRCCYTNKTIQLSSAHTQLNPIRIVQDVILHEIAHALTPGHAHGEAWKRMCVKIGAKPERLASEFDVAAFQMLAKCGQCGKNYYRQRAPRKTITYQCSQCSCAKPLVWRKNAG